MHSYEVPRGHELHRVERDRMVAQNLPWVGYLVARLCRRADRLSREDLVYVGAVGAVGAVGRIRGARTSMGELASVCQGLTGLLTRECIELLKPLRQTWDETATIPTEASNASSAGVATS